MIKPNFQVLIDHYPTILFWTILAIAAYLINLFSYYILVQTFGFQYLLGNSIAWTLSTLFAYFTTRMYIFKSKIRKTKCIVKEFVLFVVFRVIALVSESVLLYFAFRIIGINEMFSKLLASAIAWSFNAVFNQFFVFKKGTKLDGWFSFNG
ncbi:MAG: GtrA family protein [Eubacteriales bacterium]